MRHDNKTTGGNYNVFTRKWWDIKDGKRVPCATGKKRVLKRSLSREDARTYCQEYNATHDPGPHGVKAEFEQS